MNLNNGLDEDSGSPVSHQSFIRVTTGVGSLIVFSVVVVVVWMQKVGMLVN